MPPTALFAKPVLDLAVPVIRGTVVDVVDRARVVGTRHTFQKAKIGFGIKYRLVMKQETCRVDFDTTEDLYTFACAGGWHTGLASLPRPGLVQCGILAETGLVLKQQRRPWATGRFNTWVDMLSPTRLLNRIGTRQQTFGALDGKPQLVQHTANVAGMEVDTELLLNHPCHHRRGPHAGKESISNWPTVENVGQDPLSEEVQSRCSSRMRSLLQFFPTVLFIAGQPSGDA